MNKMRKKYRKGVFCVIYAINYFGNVKYLILKRTHHWRWWEFTKGGVRKEEKILDAVIREIKEETGLSPIKIKRFNIFGKYKYNKELKDREGVTGQTYSLCAVKIKKEKIKLDNLEHSNYKWLGFEKAMKKLTWPNQRKCLRVVNNYLLK